MVMKEKILPDILCDDSDKRFLSEKKKKNQTQSPLAGKFLRVKLLELS